jgi:hypothetical protein
MTIGFTGSPLQRLDRERRTTLPSLATWPTRRRACCDLRASIRCSTTRPARWSWGPITAPDLDAELALLGLLDGRPAFVALTAGDARQAAVRAAGACWPSCPATTLRSMARARSLVHWHAATPLLRPLRREHGRWPAPAGVGAARSAPRSTSRARTRSSSCWPNMRAAPWWAASRSFRRVDIRRLRASSRSASRSRRPSRASCSRRPVYARRRCVMWPVSHGPCWARS